VPYLHAFVCSTLRHGRCGKDRAAGAAAIADVAHHQHETRRRAVGDRDLDLLPAVGRLEHRFVADIGLQIGTIEAKTDRALLDLGVNDDGSGAGDRRARQRDGVLPLARKAIPANAVIATG